MVYKVLLVEDEIVAREGIRDNVEWKSAGFEFCGEAPDGEIALPLIEATQPDVLLTDIKMPFMDGLQLTKIVREHMPWVKVVILSGHDEFQYAQAALKLGVTEYLLKPISAQELEAVLRKISASLEEERVERESLKRLKEQAENNLLLLREKFLLRLIMGGESSLAAVEQSEQLGLNIIARCYQIILIKIEPPDGAQPLNYQEYQQIERLVNEVVHHYPNVLLAKKDMEELALIVKGDNPEQLEIEGPLIGEHVKAEVEAQTGHRVFIGLGSIQQRLGELHHSFSEALAKVKGATKEAHLPFTISEIDQIEMLKLEQSALENYLKCGIAEDFDEFFDNYIQPLGEAALRSYLVKHYIFMDIVLTAAQFVSDLGGKVEEVIPGIQEVEKVLENVTTLEQIREETRKIFTDALNFRNSQVRSERAIIIHQAKAYINSHFTDPDLSLDEVATHVNLSPNHFSAVFRHECGETFREYLTRNRIERAKELLRMTNLKCSEVGYRSGYNDPHYFSYIFRKNTDMTPQQYRLKN